MIPASIAIHHTVSVTHLDTSVSMAMILQSESKLTVRFTSEQNRLEKGQRSGRPG